MGEKLYKFLSSQYFLLGWMTLLVTAPILLFGFPPFYGDDYHFVDLIREQGAWTGISRWVEEYGISYRPLGIVFLYLVYGTLGFSEIAMYSIALIVFLLFTFASFWALTKQRTDNLNNFFIVGFVAFFPFAPTAFFQISSMIMIMVGILFILLLVKVLQDKALENKKRLFFLSLGFLLILFIYEQVVGLVAVLALLILLLNFKEGHSVAVKRTLVFSGVFGLISALFIAVYFFSPGNPKIVSLKKLNEKASKTQKTAIVKTKAKVINQVKPKTLAKVNRISGLERKLAKVRKFFVQNHLYAWNSLTEKGSKGYLVIFLVFISFVPIWFLPNRRMERKRAFSFLIIGFTWFTVTVAPFALYKAFHLPPYVLVIPSAGLGMMTIGLFWLLWPERFVALPSYFLKVVFSLMILAFPFQQYGYYFGLNEELSFWRSATDRLVESKGALLKGGGISLDNVPPKNNKHIFWLEKAVGERYAMKLLGEKYFSISITHDLEKNRILFEP
jgi:hypothetical protein